MAPKEFINFFNDDEQLNTLSADDRVELFYSIMKDSDDITAQLLNEIVSDYSAELEVINRAVDNFYTRDDFMQFLRDESKVNQLTREERTEIFRYALIGDSDFTVKLFEDLFEKYDLKHLEVIDHAEVPEEELYRIKTKP